MVLKNITFNFENSESITFDGAHIGQFFIDGLHTLFAGFGGSNQIEKFDKIDTFVVEVFSPGNVSYKPFGVLEPMPIFDRIKEYNDIISIDIVFKKELGNGLASEEHYSYNLNWADPNEDSNEYQQTYISDLGHLYIVASEGEQIDDYFDKKVINDKKEMELYFNLYNISV